MKKVTTIATIAVLILAVLFSVLPTGAAFAKADVTVTIKNNTGGTVSGRIGSYNFTFDPGMYEISLPEGKYDFYIATPCGNEAGQFNLNVSKELFLSCKNGGEISLTRDGVCGQVGWWYEVNWEETYGGESWSDSWGGWLPPFAFEDGWTPEDWENTEEDPEKGYYWHESVKFSQRCTGTDSNWGWWDKEEFPG